MTPVRLLAAAVLLGGLLSCTAADDQRGAGSAASTAGDALESFVTGCLAHTNMARPLCECVARKAQADMSPVAFDFLTATIRGEKARATELRGRLGLTEAEAAGTFMARGPSDCAQELAASGG